MATVTGVAESHLGGLSSAAVVGPADVHGTATGSLGGLRSHATGVGHRHGTPPPAIAPPSMALYGEDNVWICNLPRAVASWNDANNAPGSITFRAPLADCGPITPRRIVKVFWQGRARMASPIKTWTTQLASPGLCWRTFNQQLGCLAGLADGAVFPEYGFTRASDDQRTFGMMSGSSVGSGAIAGTGSAFVSAFWQRAVGRYMSQDIGFRRGIPSVMRKADPAWLSYGDTADAIYTKRDIDFVLNVRKLFPTFTTKTFEILIATDDAGTLWIDGQQLIAPESNQAYSWRQVQRVTVTLSPGIHLIAMKIENRRDNTPVAVAFVMRELNGKGLPVSPYFRRSSLNGGWLVNDGTGPPYWHKGHIVLDLLAENAALGVRACQVIRPGYTRDHDTAGAPFTDRVEKTWPVGTSFLAVVQELGDDGLDFRVDPTTLRLNSWNLRGVDRSATVFLRKGADNGTLMSHEIETTAPRANTGLIHLDNNQWMLASDDDSVDDIGVVVQSLSLGSTADRASATAAAQAMFTETANVIRNVSSQPSVWDGAIPYRDYDVGDIISVEDENGTGYMKVRVVGILGDATGPVMKAWPVFVEDQAA